jgi:hypothetical protein
MSPSVISGHRELNFQCLLYPPRNCRGPLWARSRLIQRSKREHSAYADEIPHLRNLERTRHGARKGRRGWWDDQVAGCAAPTLMTSRSAVSLLPLVSGPSSTEITTRTRKNIVLIIIGMAKPKFICTAR